ncbi:hypothetical protein E4T38_06702 [Aureobasidium subglaciale]|nr:hypothetical protein E4T38_06702 [Aureobasidium subglaciale]KAI5222443.1 hypothetical protein E4T41_06553 [Aureobasidium subglaciale]KAI5223296.1 hypothetical protein E4T40_04469 [Aureobasidium subglaciale]KAI5259894.1 hypothetical protein E4T46_06440 [Aureobasidium subglaciale]
MSYKDNPAFGHKSSGLFNALAPQIHQLQYPYNGYLANGPGVVVHHQVLPDPNEEPTSTKITAEQMMQKLCNKLDAHETMLNNLCSKFDQFQYQVSYHHNWMIKDFCPQFKAFGSKLERVLSITAETRTTTSAADASGSLNGDEPAFENVQVVTSGQGNVESSPVSEASFRPVQQIHVTAEQRNGSPNTFQGTIRQRLDSIALKQVNEDVLRDKLCNKITEEFGAVKTLMYMVFKNQGLMQNCLTAFSREQSQHVLETEMPLDRCLTNQMSTNQGLRLSEKWLKEGLTNVDDTLERLEGKHDTSLQIREEMVEEALENRRPLSLSDIVHIDQEPSSPIPSLEEIREEDLNVEVQDQGTQTFEYDMEFHHHQARMSPEVNIHDDDQISGYRGAAESVARGTQTYELDTSLHYASASSSVMTPHEECLDSNAAAEGPGIPDSQTRAPEEQPQTEILPLPTVTTILDMSEMQRDMLPQILSEIRNLENQVSKVSCQIKQWETRAHSQVLSIQAALPLTTTPGAGEDEATGFRLPSPESVNDNSVKITSTVDLEKRRKHKAVATRSIETPGRGEVVPKHVFEAPKRTKSKQGKSHIFSEEGRVGGQKHPTNSTLATANSNAERSHGRMGQERKWEQPEITSSRENLLQQQRHAYRKKQRMS